MRDRDTPRAAGRKVGVSKLHVHEPKHGPRLIEVPDEYLDRVRNYIRASDPRLTGKASPWLFPGPSDAARPWVADVFRRYVWGPLLEASGLPHLKPHGARHSYGTNLLRATGDIHYVAQQLGHSSVKVTEDYYLPAPDCRRPPPQGRGLRRRHRGQAREPE